MVFTTPAVIVPKLLSRELHCSLVMRLLVPGCTARFNDQIPLKAHLLRWVIDAQQKVLALVKCLAMIVFILVIAVALVFLACGCGCVRVCNKVDVGCSVEFVLLIIHVTQP